MEDDLPIRQSPTMTTLPRAPTHAQGIPAPHLATFATSFGCQLGPPNWAPCLASECQSCQLGRGKRRECQRQRWEARPSRPPNCFSVPNHSLPPHPAVWSVSLYRQADSCCAHPFGDLGHPSPGTGTDTGCSNPPCPGKTHVAQGKPRRPALSEMTPQAAPS